MANISQSIKFQSDSELDLEDLMSYFKKELGKKCKFSVDNESSSKLKVSGSVNETVFTKMAKYNADVSFKVQENQARIKVEGSSKPNWVFWIFVLVGLFTGIFMLIAFVLYWMQKDKPNETMRDVLNSVDTEFASI